MLVAYLDIETNYVGTFPPRDDRMFRDYKNHKLTVLGIRIVGPGRDEFVQLVGEQITKAAVLHALEGVEQLVTYNGRSVPDKVKGTVGFDFPVIAAQLGVTLDAQIPHVDLVPVCWKRGLYGGMKKVEQALGLRRQMPGKDGAWAMETWRTYVKTGERALLEQLLAYNKEDVFMLRELELALQRK